MIAIYNEVNGLPIIKIEKEFTIGIEKYNIVGAMFHYPITHTEDKTFHSLLEVYRHYGDRQVVVHTELYEPMLNEEQLKEGVENIITQKTKWLKEV